MPVPPLANGFEGGSNGSLISGGSGGLSGDPFDTVTGGPVFSFDHPAHGVLGVKFPDPTSLCIVDWHNFGSITGSVYARAYLWIPSFPVGTFLRPISMYDSGGAPRCSFEIQPSGLPRVHSGVATAAGTVAFPTSAIVRVELRGIANAGAGQVEARWWSVMDSSGPPDDTILLTGQNNGVNINGCVFGSTNTFPTTPYTIYQDDIGISSSGWIGPVLAATNLIVQAPVVSFW